MLPEGGEKTAAGVTDEFPVPGSPPPVKPGCTSIFRYREIPSILAINSNSFFFLHFLRTLV